MIYYEQIHLKIPKLPYEFYLKVSWSVRWNTNNKKKRVLYWIINPKDSIAEIEFINQGCW